MRRESIRGIVLNNTKVQEFYYGEVVFITGATGFLGKVLIEKLLRNCPGILRIYLLIRIKKDYEPLSRLENSILNEPIFDDILYENPHIREKFVVINGDFGIDGLGISDEDRNKLISDVSIVFHGAATVKFQERIDIAFQINTHGTFEVLKLCKQMKKLKSFVYVSTVASYAHLNVVSEDFYGHKYDYEFVDNIMKNFPVKELESMTPTLIYPWTTTYAFTKALAEKILMLNNNDIRIGIFRPGMVLSTCGEPKPGWIDNLYGPTGFAIQILMGAIRVLEYDPNFIINMVPVDYVANALIVSAYDITTHNRRSVIYNFGSTNKAPISQEYFLNQINIYGKKYPPKKALLRCNVTMFRNKFLTMIDEWLEQWLPAYLVDKYLEVTHRPALNLVANLQRMKKVSQVLESLHIKNTRWSDVNVTRMFDRLEDPDKETFYFDLTDFDWSSYLENYCKGIVMYLMHDNMQNVEFTKKSLGRKRKYITAIKYTGLILLIVNFYFIFMVFFRMFTTLTNYDL